MAIEKTPLKPFQLDLTGRLIKSLDATKLAFTSADGRSVVNDNFAELKNLKYTDNGIKGVSGGMTKINTTALSTHPKIRNLFQFKKVQPAETHTLVQASNSGETESKVFQNTTAIPIQGDFSATALHTDSAGADKGRFSDAPDEHVCYCNSVDTMVWGGDETRISNFTVFDPIQDSFGYDFTEKVQNTLTDAANIATLTGIVGPIFPSHLLLHLDDNLTDSSSIAPTHSVSTPGTITFATTPPGLGSHWAVFAGGPSDYLEVVDDATLSLSGGNWTAFFTIIIDDLSVPRGLFSHAFNGATTDYMWLWVDTAGRLKFFIVENFAAVVTMVSPPGTITLGKKYHILIEEIGKFWGIWLDGHLIILIENTNRTEGAQVYDSPFIIGGLDDGTTVLFPFSGKMDEFYLNSTTGLVLQSNFILPLTPVSSDSVTYIRIGNTMPVEGFKFTVETANAVASIMVVYYWDGSEFVEVDNLVDNTKDDGKSMGKIGSFSVTFDNPVDGNGDTLARQRFFKKQLGYWYAVALPNAEATTAISHVTVKEPFQKIQDFWDAELRIVNSVLLLKEGLRNNFTTNVLEDSYTFDPDTEFDESTYMVMEDMKSSEAAAAGTVTLETGTGTNVDSIVCDGITITSGAEGFDTDLLTTAENVAQNITDFASDPLYTASAAPVTASGPAQITITAEVTGTSVNEFDVTSNVTGTFTTTDTDFAGGLDKEDLQVGFPERSQGLQVKMVPGQENGSTPAEGGVTLGGDPAFPDFRVFSILVNGVMIMSGEVFVGSTLDATAESVAKDITDFTSKPNYTAESDGSVITIIADETGEGPNGFTVVCKTHGITSTTDDMSGGITLSSFLTIQYWDGSEWVNVSNLSDGTQYKNVSFGQSGFITWSPPDENIEFVRSPGNEELPLYYYRLTWTSDFRKENVRCYFIGGVPVQRSISNYKFSLHAQNRLWLFSDQAEDKNSAIASGLDTLNVFNGKGVGDPFLFGDATEVVAAVELLLRTTATPESVILVLKENAAHVVEGNNPENWSITPLSDKIGCNAPLTLTTSSLGLEFAPLQRRPVAIWQGSGGIYMYDNSAIHEISGDIANYFDQENSKAIKLSLAVNSFGWIEIENGEHYYHWHFASGSSATALNAELCFDIKRQKWFEFDRGATKRLQGGARVLDTSGNVYNYGFVTGFVQRLNTGTDFDGNAIAYHMELGDWLPAGSVNVMTIIDLLRLVTVSKTTTSSTIKVEHFGDTSVVATTDDRAKTAYYTFKTARTGHRVAMPSLRLNTPPHVFHRFKFTISTSDESGNGFEPLYIGGFYKEERLSEKNFTD